MGVTVRQKGKQWYVFITHQGRRKAKGDRPSTGEEGRYGRLSR